LKVSILQLDSLVSKLNDKEGSELLDAAKAVFNNPRATQEEVDAMVKRIVGNTKQSSQKELPNTGTSTFGTILPAMAALLSGVGLFAKKKKEDE